ncbi:hypothetical protein AB4455_00420 [Vibrio sp. 10N.261.46.E12]|uniref:hypothetical protein n=1 Tax=unclassified Vibrio TaxID=2614977 RepID=UPI0009774329|nr:MULTISPECIES: hypothetical protein [unclassified Vibrio]OMO36995.1 hypothetical protein BH584_02425 [Vibrio sp. 10N.261.45.E1]PMJ24092.1 hypothetical protein BCU27_14105 [Vibrio sp. 10N.286.45.B6]PML90098.1 hypothetical protein BCT66_05945 [Vibrio sp. 10N.261.49.E11]PMM75759.1 hypothetical protein BCT48_02740 [Vibrio sp. 10N.261.46.F12]PMM85117.1 hypothetical protein BCT46_09800 [Vibrio sp. 10N.261.46.E8]
MKTMPQRFQTLLSVSNFTLAVTALLMLLSIIVAYPLADHFSLPIQIVAHISTILVAALLKISYVGRCLAQYNLGLEVR